jgi:hypothetical protein
MLFRAADRWVTTPRDERERREEWAMKGGPMEKVVFHLERKK